MSFGDRLPVNGDFVRDPFSVFHFSRDKEVELVVKPDKEVATSVPLPDVRGSD